jgi:hypothetical protein
MGVAQGKSKLDSIQVDVMSAQMIWWPACLMCFSFAGWLGGIRAQDPASGQNAERTDSPTKTEDRRSQQLAEAVTRRMQESMREAAGREQERYDKSMRSLAALEGVTASQFEAAWRIDLEADQQPGRELVERLAAEMGLRIANAAEHAEALDAPVTIKLRDVSRLQAMELVCNQIGLYPDYRRPFETVSGGIVAGMAEAMGALAGQSEKPAEASKPEDPAAESVSLPALTLRAGKRPIPLAFAGPFGLEVTQLQEFPPDGTGTLQMCVFAGGVPASLSTYWGGTLRLSTDFRGTPLSLGKWRETGGRDIVMNDQSSWITSTSAVLPGLTTQLELWQLLRDVETIRIASEISVSLPTKVEFIRFDDLAALPVTRGSDFQITLEKVQVSESAPAEENGSAESSRCAIELTLIGPPETRVDFVALDEEGHVLRKDNVTYAYPYYIVRGPADFTPDQVALQKVPQRIFLRGTPKSLLAWVFLTEQRVSYPVEAAVGLPSFAAQPAQLMELQYDGSSPLEIEVLKIRTEQALRRVEVNMINKSNKGIRNVDAKMQFRDRTGRVLRDQVAMLNTRPEPGDSRFTLVPSKTTRPAEDTSIFVTEDVSSVTFVLKRVQFVDGTQWKPPTVQ